MWRDFATKYGHRSIIPAFSLGERSREQRMQRFKAFSSAMSEGDLAKLEHLIREWLAQQRPRILHMAQSQFNADLVISFVYEQSNVAEQLEMAEVAAIPNAFDRSFSNGDLNLEEVELPPLPEAELPY
jgi:hypothetical protein